MKLNNIPTNQKTTEVKKFLEKYKETLDSFTTLLSSDLIKDYRYDINDILNIKMDISFMNPSAYTENVVDYIKSQISYNPEITPLTRVLKRYLAGKKLNSCFNGGLSSFSLLMMIIAYVRYPKTTTTTNLGSLIVGFFEFFGKYFNFNQFVIDISSYK